MKYVDAHHHIWPAQGLPWLDGPMIPRIFGPYEPLQGNAYTIDEYKADAEAKDFSQSVYVQANWRLEDSVKEVEWVHAQHERTGWPHAIVGSADRFPDDPLDAKSRIEIGRGQKPPIFQGLKAWPTSPNGTAIQSS